MSITNKLHTLYKYNFELFVKISTKYSGKTLLVNQNNTFINYATDNIVNISIEFLTCIYDVKSVKLHFGAKFGWYNAVHV